VILDVWRSFRRLPMWVQVWVAVILVPVNMAALLFLSEPMGLWIAVLAVGGMLPNMVIMAVERGFSKAMALPHVLIWTVLVVLILWVRAAGISPGFRGYLTVLLLVDLVSLVFDYRDAAAWWKGDRAVA
jgi:hypothetical protein